MPEMKDQSTEKIEIQRLVKDIKKLLPKPLKIMEVCGTHTMSIFRHGIRSLLPSEIQLVSGPGCPVCVTDQGDLDKMIGLAQNKDVVITTFGDLIRVPGSEGSLALARAEGAQVEIVYSPVDALGLAQKLPDKQVVFLGVGFETTAPTVAATILQAQALNLHNFSVFSCHKVMPPALEALFDHEDFAIDGLLCPGHVSSIIGAVAYEPLCKKFGIPCVIAGFEPIDILQGIFHLVLQISQSAPRVFNAYPRAVNRLGNPNALALMDKVFFKKNTEWRGLGTIKDSGLAIKKEFSRFDAEKRYDIETVCHQEPKGCICGEIIRARALPTDCPLFAKRCSPTTPVGPCMVSSEGTCSAYYRYGRDESK